MSNTVKGFKVGNEIQKYDFDALENAPKGKLTIVVGGETYVYDGKNSMEIRLGTRIPSSTKSADGTSY